MSGSMETDSTISEDGLKEATVSDITILRTTAMSDYWEG